MTTTAAPTVPARANPPIVSPAWWPHWVTVLGTAITFVVVWIHPGWHPPVPVATAAAWASPALAGLSTLLVMAQHHALSKATLTAWVRSAEIWAPKLEAGVAGVVNDIPALKDRVARLEQTVSAPGRDVTALARAVLDAQGKATAPEPAAPAPQAQPAAPAAPGAS